MLKSKNRFLAVLIVIFCLFTAMGFIMFGTSRSATAAAPQAGEEFWIDGASVRLNDEKRQNALVFYLDVKAESFSNYFDCEGGVPIVDHQYIGKDFLRLKDGYSSGIILKPTYLMSGDDLSDSITINSAKRAFADTSNYWYAVYDNGGNMLYAETYVVLYNIPESNFATQITAAGYFIDNSGNYIYSQNSANDYSIAFVAKAAVDAGGLTAAQETALKQFYYQRFDITYTYGSGEGEVYEDENQSFGGTLHSAPSKTGFSFVGWKNTVTGKIDSTIRTTNYVAKWNFSKGTATDAETGKPLSYNDGETVGIATESVNYLSGSSGTVGYFFSADGNLTNGAAVRFDSTDGSAFSTDGFSFKYKLLNASEKSLGGEVGSPNYVIKILVDEGGSTVQKTVSWIPVTTGAETTFSVTAATTFVEGKTFGDYSNKFRGFIIKCGDLDGELCVNSVSTLMTGFSETLNIDLGYTVSGGALSSAIASTTFNITSVPYDSTNKVVKSGGTTTDYIANVGDYASVSGYSFRDSKTYVSKTISTYGDFAGTYGSGVLTVLLLDDNDVEHTLTIPVCIVAKGIYSEADLKAISAVSDLLKDDDMQKYAVKSYKDGVELDNDENKKTEHLQYTTAQTGAVNQKLYDGYFKLFNDITITGLGTIVAFAGQVNELTSVVVNDPNLAIFSYSVNKATYANGIADMMGKSVAADNLVDGAHCFEYNGSAWVHKVRNAETGNLDQTITGEGTYSALQLGNTYGITFTLGENRTLANGTSFTIYAQETWANITPTVIKYTSADSSYSIQIDKSTFATKVANAAGEYEFVYDGSGWTLNDSAVTLSQYGITPGGTFAADDAFLVVCDASWEPIGDTLGYWNTRGWWNINTYPNFSGTIDGNGHTVTGITLDTTSKGKGTNVYVNYSYGLIGGILSGEVKNIGFKEASLGTKTSFFAGLADGANFENIYIQLSKFNGSGRQEGNILIDGERVTRKNDTTLYNYTASNIIIDLSTVYKSHSSGLAYLVAIGGLSNAADVATIENYYIVCNDSSVKLFSTTVDGETYFVAPDGTVYLRSGNDYVLALDGDDPMEIKLDSANTYGLYSSYERMKSDANFNASMSTWNAAYWQFTNGYISFGPHTHSYIYTNVSDTQHRKTCNCGEVNVLESHTLGWAKRGSLFVYGCLHCDYMEESYDIVSKPTQYVGLKVALNDSSVYAADEDVLALSLDLGYKAVADTISAGEDDEATVSYSVDGTTVETIGDVYDIVGNYGGVATVTVSFSLNSEVVAEDTINLVLVTKFISTKEELDGLAALVTALDGKGYYAITANIDYSAKWANPIGSSSKPFLGTIDGMGHAIIDMYSMGVWRAADDMTSNHFISYMGATGELKNIQFTDFQVATLGGIVWHGVAGCKISDVSIKIKAYGLNSYSATVGAGGTSGGLTYLFGDDEVGKKNGVFAFSDIVVDYSDVASAMSALTANQFSRYNILFGKMLSTSTFNNVIVTGVDATSTTAWTSESNADLYGFKNRIIRFGDPSLSQNSGATISDGSNFGIFVYYTDGTTNGVSFPNSGWSGEFWRNAGANVMRFGHVHNFSNIIEDNSATHTKYCSCGSVSVTETHNVATEVTSDGKIRIYCTDECGYEMVLNTSLNEYEYIDMAATVASNTITGHLTAGTIGRKLNGLGGLTNPSTGAVIYSGVSNIRYYYNGTNWTTGNVNTNARLYGVGLADDDDIIDLTVTFTYGGISASFIQKIVLVTKYISSAADFLAIKDYAAAIAAGNGTITSHGYFRLAGDIALTDTLNGNIYGKISAEANPRFDNRIASFGGTIDGAGYTVDNMIIASNGNGVGWIMESTGAKVMNIGLTNVIRGTMSIFGTGAITLEDVYISFAEIATAIYNDGRVISSATYAGDLGLVMHPSNQADSTMKNVVVDFTAGTKNYIDLGYGASAIIIYDKLMDAAAAGRVYKTNYTSSAAATKVYRATLSNGTWSEVEITDATRLAKYGANSYYHFEDESGNEITEQTGLRFWSSYNTNYHSYGGAVIGYFPNNSTKIDNVVILGLPDARVEHNTVFRTPGGYISGSATTYVEGIEGATNGKDLAAIAARFDTAKWKIVDGVPMLSGMKVADSSTFDDIEIDLDVYVDGSGDLQKRNSGSFMLYIPASIYNTKTVVGVRDSMVEAEATYNFTTVLNNNRISIPYSSFPATLYGDKTFYVVTSDGCYYAFNVFFVTKTVYSVADMQAISVVNGVADKLADDRTGVTVAPYVSGKTDYSSYNVKVFGGAFKLGADIDLTTEYKSRNASADRITNWKPILSYGTTSWYSGNYWYHEGEFVGTFDGGYHTIDNLVLGGSFTGFINVLGEGAIFRNLTFGNLTLKQSGAIILKTTDTDYGYGASLTADAIKIENIFIDVAGWGAEVVNNTIGMSATRTSSYGGGQTHLFFPGISGAAFRNVVADFTKVAPYLRNYTAVGNANEILFIKDTTNQRLSTYKNVVALGIPRYQADGTTDSVVYNRVIGTNSDGSNYGVYVEYLEGSTNGVVRPTLDWDDCWDITASGTPTIKNTSIMNGVLTYVSNGYVAELSHNIPGFAFNGATFASKVGAAAGPWTFVYTWRSGSNFTWYVGDNIANGGNVTISQYGVTMSNLVLNGGNLAGQQAIILTIRKDANISGATVTLGSRQDLNLDLKVVSSSVVTDNNVEISLKEAEGYLGSTATVKLDGTTIASSVAINEGMIRFNTSNIGIRTYGDKQLVVETNSNKIVVPVLVISKGISSYADLRLLRTVSYAVGGKSAIWRDGTTRFRPGGEGEFIDTGSGTGLSDSVIDAIAGARNWVFEADCYVYDGYYKLLNDITCTGTWTSSDAVAQSWQLSAFRGTLDGAGHTIDRFTLERASDGRTYSLFGCAMTGTVKNIAFTNVSATGCGSLIASYTGEDWYSAGYTTYFNVNDPSTLPSHICNGNIKNVYVSYSTINAAGSTGLNNLFTTFGGVGGYTCNMVEDCIVDLTNATFNDQYGFVASANSRPYMYFDGVIVIGAKPKMALYGSYNGLIVKDGVSATSTTKLDVNWAAYTSNVQNGYSGFYNSWDDFFTALKSVGTSSYTARGTGNASITLGTHGRELAHELASWDMSVWNMFSKYTLKTDTSTPSYPDVPTVVVNFKDEAGNVVHTYNVTIGGSVTVPAGYSKETGLLVSYSFAGWTDGVNTYTQGNVISPINEAIDFYATFEEGYRAQVISQEEGSLDVIISGVSYNETYSLYKATAKDNNKVTSYYVTADDMSTELAFVTKYGKGYDLTGLSFNYRWLDNYDGTATATVYSVNSLGATTSLGTLSVKTGAYGTFTYASTVSDFAGLKVVFAHLQGAFLMNEIAVGHVHGTVTVSSGSFATGDNVTATGNYTTQKSPDKSTVYYYCTCGMYLATAKAGLTLTTVGTVKTLRNTSDEIVYQVNTSPSAQYVNLDMALDGSGNAVFTNKKVALDFKVSENAEYTINSIMYAGRSIGETGTRTINTAEFYEYDALSGTYSVTTGEITINVTITMTADGAEYQIALPVILVVQEIATKADLDNFATWVKAYSEAIGSDDSYEGYYRLKSDIAYNDYYYYVAKGASVVTTNHSFMTDEDLLTSHQYVAGVNAAVNAAHDAIPFNATLDGDGHAISGMKLHGKDGATGNAYVGFIYNFGSRGVLKNIAFTSIYNYYSALVAWGDGTVEDVYVDYAAYAYDSANNCSNTGYTQYFTGTFGFDPNNSDMKLSRVVINLMNDNVPLGSSKWKQADLDSELASRVSNNANYVKDVLTPLEKRTGLDWDNFPGQYKYDLSFQSATYHNLQENANKTVIGSLSYRAEATMNGVYAIVGRWNSDDLYKALRTYDQQNYGSIDYYNAPLHGIWAQYDGYTSFINAQGLALGSSSWDKWSYSDGYVYFNGIRINDSSVDASSSFESTKRLLNTDTGVSDYVIVTGESVESVSAGSFIAEHVRRAAAVNGFEGSSLTRSYKQSAEGVATNPSRESRVTETISNGFTMTVTTAAAYNADARYIVVGNEALASAYGVETPEEGEVSIVRHATGSIFVLAGKDVDYEAAAIIFLKKTLGYDALDWTEVNYNNYSNVVDHSLDSEVLTADVSATVAISNRDNVNVSLGWDNRANLGYSSAYGYYYGAIDSEGRNQTWHNSFYWLPFETYVTGGSASHWKWYSNYVSGNTPVAPNGESSGRDQLCYTAHGDATERAAMVDAAAAAISARLKGDSSIEHISFTHQDNAYFCTCSACTTGDPTPSFLILKFVNDVVKKIKSSYPVGRNNWDVNFFAYKETMAAPSTDELNSIEIDSHVGVILAPIEANFAQSVYASDNSTFKNAMDTWASRVNQVGCWFYCVNYQNYFAPYDTFATMLTWTEYAARQLHASWLFWQGTSTSYNNSSFNYFKEYIHSRASIEILDKVNAYSNADTYMQEIHEYLAELESAFFGGNVTVSQDGNYTHSYTQVANKVGYFGPSNVGGTMFGIYKNTITAYRSALAKLRTDVLNGYSSYNNISDNSFNDLSDWNATGLGTVRDDLTNMVYIVGSKKYIRHGMIATHSTYYDKLEYCYYTGTDVQNVLGSFPTAFSQLYSAYSSHYDGSWDNDQNEFTYEFYYKNVLRETLFARWLIATGYTSASTSIGRSYWFKHLGGYGYYTSYGLTLSEVSTSAGMVVKIETDSLCAAHRKALMADLEMLYISRYGEGSDKALYEANSSSYYGVYGCWIKKGSISSYTVPYWENSYNANVPAKGTTITSYQGK